MKQFTLLFSIVLSSMLLSGCNSKEKDAVLPANTIYSDRGLLIELDWNTGGSSNQALYDTDLDLYLDLADRNVEASENLRSFEEVYLRDAYKDGRYDLYVGAIDVSRRTDYNLYVSAPGGGVIYHYKGYFMAGESGEVRYLRIRKEGRRYTITDL